VVRSAAAMVVVVVLLRGRNRTWRPIAYSSCTRLTTHNKQSLTVLVRACPHITNNHLQYLHASTHTCQVLEHLLQEGLLQLVKGQCVSTIASHGAISTGGRGSARYDISSRRTRGGVKMSGGAG
jgi:hypothetical protein